MKVLFPVSELAKVYHLGGLGDVAFSLPKALKHIGVDIRVALPFHPEIILPENPQKIETFYVKYANQKEEINVFQTQIPTTNVPLYLFQNDHYLSKESGVGDEATDKFAFFSLAISAFLLTTHIFQPDVIHLNDWHVSLIPVILKHRFHISLYKTLLTIHNLNFQGTTKVDILDKLNLEECNCQVLNWDKNDGDVNLLMQGIIHSNWVNAVSPTYAHEILTDEFGAFLNPVINSLSGKLSGILNGIDYEEWNSVSDPLIHNFSLESIATGKLENKKKLYQKINFNGEHKLLVSYVGRVDPQQKGVQLIIEAIHRGLLGNDQNNFIFLGTGDPNLESQIEELAFQNPNIHATCKFDNNLAHQIYASSDLSLIPSRYEPCGLVQMIAMRYGSIPLVRQTGGLADSVVDNETGFFFKKYQDDDFCQKLNEVLQKLSEPSFLLSFQKKCFSQNFSWDESAKKYLELYKDLIF